MIFPTNKISQERFQFELETIGQFWHIPVPDFQTARILSRRINQVCGNNNAHPVFAWQVAAHAVQFFLLGQVIGNTFNRNERHQMDAVRDSILNIPPKILDEIRSMVQQKVKLDSEEEELASPSPGYSYLPLVNEIIMRSLILRNPANSDFEEFNTLIDIREGEKDSRNKFRLIHEAVNSCFQHVDHGENLLELLTYPFDTSDDFLPQLELIKEKWGPHLGLHNIKLLKVNRFIEEEILSLKTPISIKRYQFNPAPIKQPYQEKDWMRNVVLIAKNTLVWLGQLSKKYQRPITKLDQIPDEEFLYLGSHGINSLWLIGIWERSPASGKIKALYGNSQAVASAYSIYQYEVDEKLGGSVALDFLIDQAHSHGFTVGCDMVPNHTGIDSPWVVDHPDWFINSRENPREDFSYNTPNLSSVEKAEIYLDEGYYSQSGAAEVFKYINRTDSSLRYIYHGNDGTSMPWNDTAQLNYLNPEARSAVMEIIRRVAEKFDIIRFDAAMTLTKQHYKRLWFPDEGAQEHIPTREFARMSQSEFDAQMPDEFWLEVTEDLKRAHKDTLLIAEAFWLMEGFFINQLGMHRVYNSAFMHLLRDEANAQFRAYLKEILETDPLVLERFVNYLTTPDEMSAADQFGTSEKYFGMCALLATMPGLPMIGHGQIEGFSERYGMDFSSALWDEEPDDSLITAHKQLILPLLKRRERFSKADHFYLLDGVDDTGEMIEDVIAFFNNVNGCQSMVLFNNCPETREGMIRNSAAKVNLDDGKPARKTLASILAGCSEANENLVFYEIRTRDSIRVDWHTLKNQGFSFKLKPYQVLVFDIKQSKDLN